ncbi:hypothetical protein COV93_04605 [Candidatus Woesearchaeota archaeon CG11_big_fil_rev_8_21_14_0_20_43_8]|nr:MAG: hypothetical protein COV93_04605 [Candidatus Woesearchaeota archaeon CG11_big_fil_rev_8_21_14_0_20_43_8]PIO09056.1 MAG: hypothetical protein COT47_00020 [Candidatus Woesearchaeota archaeon CG08_land_8_20_14_0_20_43_7]
MPFDDYQKTIKERSSMISGNLRGPIALTKKKDIVRNEDYSLKKDDSYEQTTYSSHRFLYWSGLAFILVINFLIAIILLPLILILKGYMIYFIVGGIGILFGVIFDFLIRDLEHLEKRHHLFAATLIPIIGILDLMIINFVSKNLAVIFKVKISHNPLVAGSVYILAFMIPFAYSLLIRKDV